MLSDPALRGNIHMKQLLLITLLVLSSGPACADWMSFGASDSGTTVYADPTTKSRDGDLVNMWVRWNRGGELGLGFITVAVPDKERLDQLLTRMKEELQG